MRIVVAAAALLLAPSAALATQYANVAVVALSGGEYTSPVDAMNKRPDWCPTPGPATPCLLKIMPGTYELSGIAPYYVNVPAYVDVEGSGVNTTILKNSGPGPYSTVIQFSSLVATEVRSLSVENTSAGDDVMGIVVSNSPAVVRDVAVRVSGSGQRVKAVTVNAASNAAPASVVLDRVTVSATGLNTTAVVMAVESGYANLSITNSSLTATGGLQPYGIYGNSTLGTTPSGVALTVSNASVSASGGSRFSNGVYSKGPRVVRLSNVQVSVDGVNSWAVAANDNLGGQGATVRVDGCRLSAISPLGYGSYVLGGSPGSFVGVGATRLDGAVPEAFAGPVVCAHCYSGTYVELGSSCR